MAVSPVLPLPTRRQRLQRDVNIGATAGASAPAVYASRVVLPPPMQDSLPAGWLTFAARESNPLDRDERFPSPTSSSPFPGFILTLPAHDPELPSAVDRRGRRYVLSKAVVCAIRTTMIRTLK